MIVAPDDSGIRARRGSWLSAWAKSFYDAESGLAGWLPLCMHSADSAGIAALLVRRWVSPQVVRRIGEDLPNGPADVGILASWLAGVHDVGKVSPAFAVQVPFLADRMRAAGLAASPLLASDPHRARMTHSLVGFVAVRDWLVGDLGFSRRGIASQLASVVGSHHGVAPDASQVADVELFPHLTGDSQWEQARAAVLEFATERAGGRDVLSRFAGVQLSRPSVVLLTGIVIMADWIASNSELFPLWPISTAEDPVEIPDEAELADRVHQAWTALALPARWSPRTVGNDLDAEFSARFPHVRAVRPAQAAVVEMARAQAGAGVIVFEAPMGVGKTEAAMIAAEILAGASGADGVFIALPTQATTNAMFSRALNWLRSLHGAGASAVDINLAHGKTALNDEFSGLLRSGTFACVGADEDDGVAVHQWMRGSKKGPLASFVVGTIDQVLVAALKSRHVMLRHLALAGKVVVIDEVHAYDVYMSVYLRRVLQWLGAYGVPVVLLSATLPAARRQELLDAYAQGRSAPGTDTAAGTAAGYPLVSSDRVPAVVVPAGTEGSTVLLDRIPDDLDALVAYLRRHLHAGGCAAVVRNTVTRVQETADRLVQEFGADAVTVNHSRFLGCDRARLDEGLVRRFGRDTPAGERPGLHIVVASQVLEQSLDVDFDLLVTDLAPIDLVLQRLGRLHRHDRARPAGVVVPRCAVTGVQDWTGAPVRAVPGSQRVYGEDTLLRAAALLLTRGSVRLPQDISPLVQQAYGTSALGPASWQQAMAAAAERAAQQARQREAAATTFLLGAATDPGSLVGWLQAGVGDAEGPHGAAQVRDGAESLEVLVVQRDEHGGLLTSDWIATGAGRQIPLDEQVPYPLAKIIAACGLRLPLALSHGGVVDEVITALERNCFASFAQSPLLSGQLVLVLDAQRQAVLRASESEFVLTYEPHRGLRHDRH
ncbi:CRISPR-associated helicase Cas3' [Amycolatopsis lurida]